jgi:hypothetical protein
VDLMEAPERIWAYPSNVTGWDSAIAHNRPILNSTEFVRADLAQAPDAGVPCPHPDVYDSGNCCGGHCFAPDAGVVAELVEAAKALQHAVCGPTGFAEAVRHNTGLALPWPSLDAAEERLSRALALIAHNTKEPSP